MASKNNDIELWNAFKMGSEYAFEQLYQRYAKVLAGFGYRILADRQLVEDAIQDLFIDLWRRKEYLSEVENVKYYLFKALRNQLSRNTRNEVFEKAEDINDFLDYLVTLSSENQSIEAEIQTNRTQVIQTALTQLSNRQREAIHLRYYQGLDLDQTAELMALPKQVVKNLLSKSYAILRLSLKTIVSLCLFLLVK